MGWFEKKSIAGGKRLPWLQVITLNPETRQAEEPPIESQVRHRLQQLEKTMQETQDNLQQIQAKASPNYAAPANIISAAEQPKTVFKVGLPFQAHSHNPTEPAKPQESPRPVIFAMDDYHEATFGIKENVTPAYQDPPAKTGVCESSPLNTASSALEYEYKIRDFSSENQFVFGYPLQPPAVTEENQKPENRSLAEVAASELLYSADNEVCLAEFYQEPVGLQEERELQQFFDPLASQEIDEFFSENNSSTEKIESKLPEPLNHGNENVHSSAITDITSRPAESNTVDNYETPAEIHKSTIKQNNAPPVTANLKEITGTETSAKVKLPSSQDRSFAEDNERASVTPRLKLNRQIHIPFNLLHTQKKAFELADPRETQAIITKLEETLDQFGIEGRVIGIQRGPIITRYELKMAPGIKVNRILSLTDELAMALEALRVRIEAPIPGRSTVGIEIPNKDRLKVLLGDIVNDPGFHEYGGELPLPIGKDIAGNLVLEDLTRLPHLLIAGATGSGKSVAVNSFITSLILTKSPEEVRFLLVDPKLVELSHYNDIPHLLHPVITDHQKAILALNWAVEEMERRYEDLAEMRVRDIRSYNARLQTLRENRRLDPEVHPPMPYIVVLIDELGDLMMVAGKEVEASIIRLAQKARAVGIHLILATQRPSVDVITALIKANCPARIALQVAQKTDSRTILDANGAEQLVGQGDLLFKHPNRGQLIRVQAPLVLDDEVESVVTQAKKIGKPEYITLEDPKGNSGNLEPEEEQMFDEAWQIIVESGKASASYLQRRLRIGYNRAARLIEAFEARGMIGPQIGSKPREIFGR